MEFYTFLRKANEVKDIAILHDLSNKFNILGLSIEEIEELLEGSDQISHEDLKTSYDDILTKKNKFILKLNELKLQVRSSSETGDIQNVFTRVLEVNQKGLREKEFDLSLVSDIPIANNYYSFELLNLMVRLRLESSQGEGLLIDLSLDKNQVFDNEKLIADKCGASFSEKYMDYFRSLYHLWQATRSKSL